MLASKSSTRISAAGRRPFIRMTPCHACPFKEAVVPDSTAATKSKAPLIDRLGGPDTVKVAVDIFYKKVLADERIKDYFAGTNMAKQRAHQAAFMTYAFGGPNLYQGKDLAEAHRGLVPHLDETHFNAVAENFVATLQELGVPQEDIDAAVQIVASTKDQVLAE